MRGERGQARGLVALTLVSAGVRRSLALVLVAALAASAAVAVPAAAQSSSVSVSGFDRAG